MLHGAVLFAMVDTAMGAATMSTLDEGQACASIEVHLRFPPRSRREGCAEVSVIKGGRRIIQLEGRVFNADGVLVATASGSFAVINALES